MSVVLITGTGLIGAELAKTLEQNGYQVRFLSTSKREFKGFPCYYWNVDENKMDEMALDNVDHIVHLAGAGIADKRWTKTRKKELLESRTGSGELLLSTLVKRNLKVETFISASGIGYYGAITTDKVFNESDEPGNDFLSEICIAWEKVGIRFNEVSDHVVIYRFAIVLSNEGGALSKLTPIFKNGLGSAIGKGNQYMSWVHINDVVNAIQFAITNTIDGIYNLAADEDVTNKEFSSSLAESLGKRIFLPAIPSFIIKLRFGELSRALLYGSRVSNNKIKEVGFKFQYEKLKSALNSIFR